MKLYRVVLGLVLVAPLMAGEPAHVILTCASLRFQTATGGPGQTLTMDITGSQDFTEWDGELRPLYRTDLPSYGGSFRLQDATALEDIYGLIAFDTPPFTDANNNGFDDFFETSQSVGASTLGLYDASPVDAGDVAVKWSRAAGSSTGTCLIQLTSRVFQQLPDLKATFELLEYTGPLNYVLGTNQVTGTVSLSQTGTPSNTLTGAVTLTRISTNRFNFMTLLAGSLTNATGQPLTYTATPVERDQKLQTNYYGFPFFPDGEPSTGTLDYQDWLISIDDANDTNANGIPDLSDDPGVGPPLGPSLGLIRTANQLVLNITAPAAATYDLEHNSSVVSTNWVKQSTITLTNSVQTIPVPIPDSRTQFWRLKSP